MYNYFLKKIVVQKTLTKRTFLEKNIEKVQLRKGFVSKI